MAMAAAILVVDYEHENRHPTYSLGYGPTHPSSCFKIDGPCPSRVQDVKMTVDHDVVRNASSDYGIEDGE